MGKFAVSKASLRVGQVILVSFPFSNLQGQKKRPALILAKAGHSDLILCQITSKPYASKSAIRIKRADFASGQLPIVSYIRPDKLFTADASIITRTVGKLNPKKTNSILAKVRSQFTSI